MICGLDFNHFYCDYGLQLYLEIALQIINISELLTIQLLFQSPRTENSTGVDYIRELQTFKKTVRFFGPPCK